MVNLCVFGPSLKKGRLDEAVQDSDPVLVLVLFTAVVDYAVVLTNSQLVLDGTLCASLVAVLMMSPASCR